MTAPSSTTPPSGMSERGDEIVMRFDQTGDFAALNAAHAWCREHGVSFGSTDRTGTIALMAGDYAIAKWRNLSPFERHNVDGTIAGDARNGPLTLRIARAAIAKATGDAP